MQVDRDPPKAKGRATLPESSPSSFMRVSGSTGLSRWKLKPASSQRRLSDSSPPGFARRGEEVWRNPRRREQIMCKSSMVLVPALAFVMSMVAPDMRTATRCQGSRNYVQDVLRAEAGAHTGQGEAIHHGRAERHAGPASRRDRAPGDPDRGFLPRRRAGDARPVRGVCEGDRIRD